MVLSIAVFAALMTGSTYLAYRRYGRARRMLRQIGGPVSIADGPRVFGDEDAGEEAAVTRLLRKMGEFVPVSPADASYTRRAMIAAGYRNDNAVGIFYGIKVVCAVAGLIASLLLMDAMGKTMVMRIVFLAAGAGGGYVLPGFFLERMIKKRQETLRLSLPDALDLMVVSVEAGLGLDQAIQHVSRELQPTHPEISEEWGLVTLEMRAGKRRSDALRNLAERTGEPELRKLVAILVQNDRFGTSMAESLRSHSDFMRTRRRQEAEERAGKVGVKLIFPIFFFILPSMMVVTAGPALLQIFKYLFPLMAGAVK
ncbi:MAG: type II secretion system F family protein [Bryobacteraceae bacterium]